MHKMSWTTRYCSAKRSRKGTARPRPPGSVKHTYASLIALAVENSSDGKLMLQEIYDFVEERLQLLPPEAQEGNSQCWKNSIRHNLSLRSCFVKVPRKDAGGKKLSSWWTLDRGKLPTVARRAIEHTMGRPVSNSPIKGIDLSLYQKKEVPSRDGLYRTPRNSSLCFW